MFSSEAQRVFINDLEALLDPKIAEAVETSIGCLPRIFGGEKTNTIEKAASMVTDKTGVPKATATSILRLLSYFAQSFLNDDEDAPSAERLLEGLSSDLAGSGFSVDATRGALLLPILKRVEESCESTVRKIWRTELAKSGVLPAFEQCFGTTEIRAVGQRRSSGRSDSPSEKPNIVGIVPVASICIALDTGNPNQFFFQTSESGLDSLINSLEAVRNELKALQAAVAFKGYENT